MMDENHAAPVEEKFLSPGVMVMLGFMAVGTAFAAARFLFGIGAVSNLNNQFPWGLWIGVDVASGVALAAGGFTTGAIAYVFNRREYHSVIRPALLTAMLGYTFVVLGLLVDIGRYWNITSPLFNHNGNSVLFEVAMCVMIYLHVLYIEFVPIAVERFKGRVNLPGILSGLNPLVETVLDIADRILGKVMFLFIIAGIVLSCLHQSSLGTLMLIAPYKVHPLWYTPILPLLFLTSALAAGYPMVAFESIIVAKSFGRKPEMEVLTPLARFMPLLMGIYLAAKIGDMLVRGTYRYLLDGTVQTNAFIVEVLFGVLLPFTLLLFKKVRKSPGWLFFASTVFVLGILLNRINVFLVSYTPPYVIKSYFPAVGEIFITVGLIAGLMFFYRVFVAIFPVLGACPKQMSTPLAVLFALGVSLWPLSMAQASKQPAQQKLVLPALEHQVPSVADAPKIFELNSPLIKTYSDFYEPVRFMHGKHANVLKDCTICHHRIPRKKSDKEGQHLSMKVLRAAKKRPVACTACHDRPFQPKRLEVPGLKGAYHRLCMDCHSQAEQVPYMRGPITHSAMVRGPITRPLDTRAPNDCLSCHAKKVTDHKNLVKLPDKVDALAVTRECLRCHEKEGKAILETSHWKWQGPSPYSIGHEKRIDLGKRHYTINNFCININGNWPDCTGCHIGYGWKDADFDFTDISKIDCLVCHDRTEWKEYVKTTAGWPAPDVDLKVVAENVGRPDRADCGTACHFTGGHGDATKHGALNSALDEMEEPTKELDIHMGGMDFKCQDCHKMRNHMVSGRSVPTAVSEGDISCEYCHTDHPHIGTSLIDYHLNKHTAHVACQTCHIPVYSKTKPTEILWDWSKAAEHTEYEHGKKVWKQAGRPTYMWFNGTTENYVLGDRINETGVTALAKPVGSIDDPVSKIYPFKPHLGVQISDAVNKYLLVPQLWSGFAKHWDWDRAVRDGMKSTGLPYSGKYEFVKTISYMPVTHEILPKESTLSCGQCHRALTQAPYCGRCHKEVPGTDFGKLASQGIDFKHLAETGTPVEELIGISDYVDFKALGYAGDPIEVGGRFSKVPFRVEAPAKLARGE